MKGLTARGYHGLGEKNRKRFNDGEFATSDGAVFYNRGLKFVGRMDLQVSQQILLRNPIFRSKSLADELSWEK